MPAFQSKAGKTVKGTIDAVSTGAAISRIRQLDYYPISTAPVRDRLALPSIISSAGERRIANRDLSVFTQELAALLAAGMPLEQALAMLANFNQAANLRQAIEQVQARVRDGASFADSLAADRRFPPMYVSMARAGEAGGNLDQSLKQLAEYLASAYAIRQAVISALIYPILLLITAVASVSIILIFVIPAFAPLFRSAGKKLPGSAQFLLGLSDFLSGYWWLVVALLAGLCTATLALWHKDTVRDRIDGYALRLPIMGKLLGLIQVERFCRTMAALLSNGVPLPSALALTQSVLTNQRFRHVTADAARKIREGDSLAARLRQSRIFPSSSINFVKIGEEIGKLDEMLLKHADFCARNIRHSIDRLLAILVPALTIALGLVVAGLISTILVSILSINELAT